MRQDTTAPGIEERIVLHDQSGRVCPGERSESLVDSTVGVTGAAYAIRRSLFEVIPPDTILDDVVIPARVVRKGYRVLFEPSARAWDRMPSNPRQELTRKARTIAGNFQLFARERWLWNPRQNRLWAQTLSHKGLRLLAPLLHLGALLGAALAAGPLYQGLFLAQMAFYTAAVAGHGQRGARRRSRLLSVPYSVCVLNAATVAGFLRFAAGRQRATWDPTSAPAAAALTARPIRRRW